MSECFSCTKEAAIAVMPAEPVLPSLKVWEEEYCFTHFALWGGRGELVLSTARLIVKNVAK